MLRRVVAAAAAGGGGLILVVSVATIIGRATLGAASTQQTALRFVGDTWLAEPGAVAVHQLVLQSDGAVGAVALDVSGNHWQVDVPEQISATSGGSHLVPVTVTVPFSVSRGAIDAVEVAAAAQSGSARASVRLYTSTSGEFTGQGYVGCRYDLDTDGLVDGQDTALVSRLFGEVSSAASYDPALDFNHDGRIGAADVQAVAGRTGESCPVMPSVDTAAYRGAVAAPGIRDHLEELEAIADRNAGNRSVGTSGYEASKKYVVAQLEQVGYAPSTQEFGVDFWEELSPSVLQRKTPDPRTYGSSDFRIFDYSGSGDVTALVQAVDLVLPPGAEPDTSTSGCEGTDFAAFVPGRIALLQRGGCSFAQKAVSATDAGASGVLIFNEGQSGRTGVIDSSLYSGATSVPVFGTSFELGEELAAMLAGGSEVQVHMFAHAGIVQRSTENVLADVVGEDPSRVVIVGAHLDSVPAGAGINDNGSGAALILEMAVQMRRLGIVPHNTVAFRFWAAEERGLLGSLHYTENLTPLERDRLLLNLNFDMVGSPNYVRYVYDGMRLPGPGGEHPGSEEIEAVFERYLDSQELAWETIGLGGASDHAPFSALGVPAGGLFTGAGSVKTAAQAAVYGGTAGQPLDPCYHRACDRLDNVSWEVLDQMAKAAAHTVLTYAMDEREVMARPPSDSAVQVLSELEYRGPLLQR